MWSLAGEQSHAQAGWRFKFWTNDKNKDYQTEIKCNFYEEMTGSSMKQVSKPRAFPMKIVRIYKQKKSTEQFLRI
jgi:hypothetical protein